MQRLLGIAAFLFTISILIVAGTLLWAAQQFYKPGPAEQARLFIVQSGQGVGSISYALDEQDLIDNPQLFKWGVKLSGADTAIKAGEYEIAAGASMNEIMLQLEDGKAFQRTLTVPEGLTSYETVNLINVAQELSGEPVINIPQEGSLFPETYSYQKNEPRTAVLARMKTSMEDLRKELCPKEPCWPAPLKSWDEVITLASIVEKETGQRAERARVAGVFINRLRKGIALQTDPTVIYALHQGRPENKGQGPIGRRLLRKDLDYDSPYNTYKYPGLPPGPIANPGEASIRAVLNPEEHDLYYFVADGTGGHVFAKTLEEHNRNAANWRKIRRSQQ